MCLTNRLRVAAILMDFLLIKIIYTVSKGQFSIFFTWSDLGSVKHQTQAEVDDCVRTCKAAMKEYKVPIASIDVDNAARLVAAKAAANDAFKGMTILVIRDPSHCVDLLSKDLAGTDVVRRVMAESKEVRDFVKIDRIDSIRVEKNETENAEYIPTAISISKTRM